MTTARVTAFLNQKGGVGKTTLSCNFGTALALDGARVLLVDADPQHGAITWLVHSQDDFFCFSRRPKKTSNWGVVAKISCDKMNLTMY